MQFLVIWLLVGIVLVVAVPALSFILDSAIRIWDFPSEVSRTMEESKKGLEEIKNELEAEMMAASEQHQQHKQRYDDISREIREAKDELRKIIQSEPFVFSSSSTLDSSRSFHDATLLPDGRVFLAGYGMNEGTPDVIIQELSADFGVLRTIWPEESGDRISGELFSIMQARNGQLFAVGRTHTQLDF